MLEVDYITFHNPFFLGGKNHGQKVFCRNGFEAKYDEERQIFHLTWNGETKKKPIAAVDDWIDESVRKEGKKVAPLPQAEIVHRKAQESAQVSTPMDHVFQGEGAGKKRR